jgi:signal transduction histidine kinase
MTNGYQRFFSCLWKFALLYLLIVVLIIRKGRWSDIKLFEPLRVMSATANRLTVNNLHSERLNVEGTKNELKDLAIVINAMLDRIEMSYESQKQFVSDASHELRTPIAVIQGYANMLNRWGSSNEEVLQESIEAIQNEAKSMQDLVEKLLFLSRHDKKTMKLIKKRFNMRPVVEDMVKETKLVAGNRIISNPIMEDVIVYGDKQSLKQAIRIFIDNSVKYTEDGDEITILCQKVNEECVITVSDTGIGMTKEDLDHIFSRFYRSEHVRDKNISGHGLGLSLAKLIILAHTGKIKVRSQYKVGTSFIITIPKRKF